MALRLIEMSSREDFRLWIFLLECEKGEKRVFMPLKAFRSKYIQKLELKQEVYAVQKVLLNNKYFSPV